MAKSKLLRGDALKIAAKLGASVEKDGKHQKALFYYNGMLIFRFGIRHGRDSGHGHLVGENRPIYLNESRAVLFARCQITLDHYVAILKQKGVILDRNETVVD